MTSEDDFWAGFARYRLGGILTRLLAVLLAGAGGALLWWWFPAP
jgi:uncharacterized RDD family membrane protein YckC